MPLADWVLADHTYHFENLHILYGGFNPLWAAGRLEREVANSIGQKFVGENPGQSIHLLIPNWYSPADVIKHVQDVDADIIVLCSLSDPLGIQFADCFPGKKVYQAGYTTQGLPVDFWAIACLQNFKQYTDAELEPVNPKLFLNYNRKPHPHRIALVDELERTGLIDLGYVTLEGRYTLGDTIDDYVNSGALESVNTYTAPNDIYSLGNMDVWRDHLINVVSETNAPTEPVFLSEKIFKPIIGMRPFIINGSNEIQHWLKSAGFDCFEDLFSCNIIQNLLQYKDKDLMAVYDSIRPRLLRNRHRFFEYATEQLGSVV